MDNKLPKHERLSGRKRIDELFASGQGGFVFPFKYIHTVKDSADGDGGLSVIVSVPKKMHKLAVRRNKIKRRTREAFRTSKTPMVEKALAACRRVDIALIYVSKETEDYPRIQNAVGKILAEIAEGI